MMLAPWVTSHCGERSGWWFSPYDGGMDEHTWSLMIGWGGRAIPPPRPGYLDPLYRFSARVEWRPLATCFEWWVEYLGVESQWHHRGYAHTRIPCGIVRQYRIHSFRRWPVSVRWIKVVSYGG